jgi:hypothetical protein
MLSTVLGSIPSMAIMAPRTSGLGDVGPGERSGGEIWASTLILFRTGIDMIIASTPELCDSAKGAFTGARGTTVSIGGSAMAELVRW